MKLDRYTELAKKIFFDAMETAKAMQNQALTTGHLAKTILSQDKKRLKKAIESCGGNFSLILNDLEKALKIIPKVEGHQNLFIDKDSFGQFW